MMRLILLLAALLLTGALAACGSETPADTATPRANACPGANVHARTDGNACFTRLFSGHAHGAAGAYGSAARRQRRNCRT